MTVLKRDVVRKNITMNSEVANQVERLSKLSGLTQGEIIESALSAWKPRMQFVMADSDWPIADACDIYICSHQGSIDGAFFDAFVQMFRRLLDNVSFNLLDRDIVNEYVHGHIPAYLAEVYPVLKDFSDMADADMFAPIGEGAFRENIKSYINFLLGNRDNPDVVTEDYLLRNLIVIFRDVTVGISDMVPMERGKYRALQYDIFASELKNLL